MGVVLLDLPEEIVFDILHKLPVKAMCKLKCVSKGWLNLLSDPKFLKNCRDAWKKKPNLLLLRQDGNKLHVSWGSGRGNDHDAFTLLLPSDKAIGGPMKKPSGCELICLWASNGYYVLNPSTCELLSFPREWRYERYAGFGYVAASDEYVLLHLFDDYGSDSSDDYGSDSSFIHLFRCEILKFSDGNAVSCSWELLDTTCPPLYSPAGVFVGNKFFWISNDFEYKYKAESYVMADFDLESNQFNTIPLPGYYFRCWEGELVELKEELCLVDIRHDSSTMDLWILKDYPSHKWVKEYSIYYAAYPTSAYDLTLFYYWDGKVLLNWWSKGMGQHSIVCYDTKTTSFKTITNLTRTRGYTYTVDFTQGFFSLGTRSNKANRGDVNASKGAATETIPKRHDLGEVLKD